MSDLLQLTYGWVSAEEAEDAHRLEATGELQLS